MTPSWSIFLGSNETENEKSAKNQKAVTSMASLGSVKGVFTSAIDVHG